MFTGQCNCRPGVRGRTCSETIPGNFFPTIDHLRLEGETADGVPSYLIITSGEDELFTGTGYYTVIDRISIANFGTLVPPASGEYEVLFRYNLQGAMTWNTASLTIRASDEEGNGPAACSELPVGDSEFQYTMWMMGIGLTISQTFCLRGGRSYTFILGDFDSGQTDGTAVLDIDALVAIPVSVPGLRVFSDPELSAEYTSCVDSWRSLLTQPSANPSCEEVTFAVSTELYNGTLGRLAVSHASFIHTIHWNFLVHAHM